MSAQNFVQSTYFRKEIKKRIPAGFIAIPEDVRPDTTQYRVVYAIVDRKEGAPSQVLPLFSKQTFEMAKRNLDALGYRVSLLLVKAV